MVITVYQFLKFFFSLNVVVVYASFLKNNYPATVIEDALLDTPGLITKYKYPVETHYVTTADKYILCMHRIPRKGGIPIFLMHGLLDASGTWIFMGPWNALGYYLYENGYDVWMGNARGNRYSRNHSSVDPNNNGIFWKFSWHEIGFYDLPAMIDYVLQKTKKAKLTYIGHSQGTTSFFVMCSMRPKFCSKINSMHAIAPVAFMKHIKTPLNALGQIILAVLDEVPEFLPHSDIALNLCSKSKSILDACIENFFLLMGKETKEVNATMWPVLLGQLPAGAASRQIKHYIQMISSDRFCQFDHGVKDNIKRYGKPKPPDYALENVKVPVGLYYTYNDFLTNEIDVKRLARMLPNVVDDYLIPYKKWNHVTPVWGIHARELLHTRILKVLQKFV